MKLSLYVEIELVETTFLLSCLLQKCAMICLDLIYDHAYLFTVCLQSDCLFRYELYLYCFACKIDNFLLLLLH